VAGLQNELQKCQRPVTGTEESIGRSIAASGPSGREGACTVSEHDLAFQPSTARPPTCQERMEPSAPQEYRQPPPVTNPWMSPV